MTGETPKSTNQNVKELFYYPPTKTTITCTLFMSCRTDCKFGKNVSGCRGWVVPPSRWSHLCATIIRSAIKKTRSYGGPPGPDFLAATLWASFEPFGRSWLCPLCAQARRERTRKRRSNGSRQKKITVLFENWFPTGGVSPIPKPLLKKYPLNHLKITFKSP